MKLIDDTLDNIDAYFEEKSDKDRIYSYIMAILGVSFLIYFFTYDMTAAMYDTASKERTSIVKVLREDKRYISNNSKADIQYYEERNKKLKVTFSDVNKMSQYINLKITELKPLIYNKTAWGKFIDSISKIANTYQIHIQNIKNNFVINKKDFGHVLDLEVTFNGNFHNTLRYINALEKTPLVVDIHSMTIDAGERDLTTHLKIAVWGISY